MAVFKRNGIYYIRFKFQGRIIYKSTKQSSRKLALELEAKVKKELWDQVYLGKSPEYYWVDAATLYIKETTKKTRFDDFAILEWLLPHFQDLTLRQVDFNKAEEIKRLKLAEGVRASTINKYLQVIQRVLKKAFQKGWINGLPSFEMCSVNNARTRWLTFEEAEKLSSILPSYLADMMNFTLATGLRESNVRLLRWSQIDIKQRTLLIDKDNAKNKRNLMLPLNQSAMTILSRQEAVNEYVFNHRGKPLYRCQTTSWKKALKECGISNFRWHDLRHTWASWHIQNGTPLHELQALGGWSDIGMVLRYAHLATDNLKSAAERLDEVKRGAKRVQPKLKIVGKKA